MMILIGICFLSLVLLSVPGFHVAGDVTVSTLSSHADTAQGWSSEHQFGMLSFVALGRLWGGCGVTGCPVPKSLHVSVAFTCSSGRFRSSNPPECVSRRLFLSFRMASRYWSPHSRPGLPARTSLGED